MKWLLWLAVLCLLAPNIASGQGLQRVPGCGTEASPAGNSPGTKDTLGNGCITAGAAVSAGASQFIGSLSSAVALAPPSGATKAIITVESQSVRWRDDGVAPTASVGNLLPVGTIMFYTVLPLANMKLIETTASAAVTVSYYK